MTRKIIDMTRIYDFFVNMAKTNQIFNQDMLTPHATGFKEDFSLEFHFFYFHYYFI